MMCIYKKGEGYIDIQNDWNELL